MIYEIAGYLGIDPRPYSYRKLFWMFQGKLRRVRTMIVNHAAISSGAMSAQQVQNYIQRGQLDLSDPSQEEVIPYDQDVLKSIIRQNGM